MRTYVLIFAAAMAVAVAGCGGGNGSGDSSQTNADLDEVAQIASDMKSGADIGVMGSTKAVVGESFVVTVAIVPNDHRNGVEKTEVTSSTVGGSSPTWDGVKLSWVPNEEDFLQSTVLLVTVTLKSGEVVKRDVSVTILREETAIIDLGGSTGSTFADDDGYFLIKATSENSGALLQGDLIIRTFKDKGDVLRDWEVSAPEGVRVEVLQSPAVVGEGAVNELTTQSEGYPLSPINLALPEFKALSAGGGRDGSYLDWGANVFSSRKSAAFNYTNWQTITAKRNISYASKKIKAFNFLASCRSRDACRSKSGAPVILIHGFTGTDNTLLLGKGTWGVEPTGGNDGTWFTLPEKLSTNHAVFEFQWHTYMRFEEAAGKFNDFTTAVAEYTGKKPIVIAHSFGGIVSTLSVKSQGIVFDEKEKRWIASPFRNQIAKLITLNSPLSGINDPKLWNSAFLDYDPNKASHDGSKSFQMTRGRDETDATIGLCYAISCLQAGANLSRAGDNLPALERNAALIAGLSVDLTVAPGAGWNQRKVWSGETIYRLQKEGVFPSSVDVLRFAGFQSLAPKSDVKFLGDGLISLIAQAAHPQHFASSPYNESNNFGYAFFADELHEVYNPFDPNEWDVNEEGAFDKFKVITPRFNGGPDIKRLHYSFYGSLVKTANAKGIDLMLSSVRTERKKFKDLLPGECIKWNPAAASSSPYIVCTMSAHTGGTGASATVVGKRMNPNLDFSIANVGSEDAFIKHPLLVLLKDVNWVASLPVPFVATGSCESDYYYCSVGVSASPYIAKVEFDGSTISTASSIPKPALLFVTFTNKQTGAYSRDFTGTWSDGNGAWSYDASAGLAREFGPAARLDDYRMKVSLLTLGYEPVQINVENLVEGGEDLGVVRLKPLGSTVAFGGVVIDGQTNSSPIAGATVRMAAGVDLDAMSIVERSDARSISANRAAVKVTTDPSGRFAVTGLRPGDYSVLVSKVGYLDQLQGRVNVAGNGNITLSMLRVLPEGENSVTLRWVNGSAGAGVASDLDSHLLRLSGGSVDYHVYFGNRTVSGSSDSLDRDDTDFEGPETVTFASVAGKDFVYYVHNFSGGSTSIVDSRARVTLRYAGRTLQFSPPSSGNQGARYWRVFDIVNGTIVRCVTNCLQDAAPSGIATQGEFSGIPAQWRNALTQLPSKH